MALSLKQARLSSVLVNIMNIFFSELSPIKWSREFAASQETQRWEFATDTRQRIPFEGNKAIDLQRAPAHAESLSFLKEVGSNFKIDHGQLSVTPKKAWKLAVELNKRVRSGELSPFSQDTNRLLYLILETARTEYSSERRISILTPMEKSRLLGELESNAVSPR
jgi:hypothetical protein